MQRGSSCRDHPWRRFRAFVEWTLQWQCLPDGMLGRTDFASRTVTLTVDLSQAERRCTIAHEVEHITAGPVPAFYWPREELRIDEAVACRLIELEDLADALAWSLNVYELADELWVDVPTARARLATLTEQEGQWLRDRLGACIPSAD